MLAMALPKASHHQLITNKMKKIPTGTDYNILPESLIISQHISAYKELYDETKEH